MEESSHYSPSSPTLSIIRHFSFLPGEWVCNMNVRGFNWPFPDYSWKRVSFYVFFCLMQIYCKFTSKFGFTLLWRSFLLSNWANIWFNITSTQELKIHFYIPYKMQNKTSYLYIHTRSKIFFIYWDGKILWIEGYLFSRFLKCCHKLTSHFREKLNT